MFVAIIVFMLSPNNTHIEHERNKKKKIIIMKLETKVGMEK